MTQTGEAGAVTASDELSFWLLEESALSTKDLDQARRRRKETGAPLGTILLDLKLLKEDTLVDVLARRRHLPKAPERLHRQQVSVKALTAIPEDLCWQYGIFPFDWERQTGRLCVAANDPCDAEMISALEGMTGGAYDLYVAGPRAIEKAIRKHYLDGWVEESRKEDAAKLRFFGYEGITHPGVASREVVVVASPKLPVSSNSAGPARPPKPTKPTQSFGDHEGAGQGKGAQKEARDPSGAMQVARVKLKVPGDVLAPDAALGTPPDQAQVAPSAPADIVALSRRVQILEEGVALLLRLMTERGDARLAEEVDRVKKILG